MVQEHKDLPHNKILEVIENGYYVDDPQNVLKPARVIISKKPRDEQKSNNVDSSQEEHNQHQD